MPMGMVAYGEDDGLSGGTTYPSFEWGCSRVCCDEGRRDMPMGMVTCGGNDGQ